MVRIRTLGRLATAELAKFYVAGGASLYLPDRDTALSLCGRIDLALPFASIFVLDIFGFVWRQDAGFGMAFGSGIHFYFLPRGAGVTARTDGPGPGGLAAGCSSPRVTALPPATGTDLRRRA